MPIYEYACSTCGITFEKRQGFNDAPISEYDGCPNGKISCNVQRLISPPAVVFKGSGFYITDTRNGNGSGKNSKPATKTESESKTETSSDTKSETKSEKKETNSASSD